MISSIWISSITGSETGSSIISGSFFAAGLASSLPGISFSLIFPFAGTFGFSFFSSFFTWVVSLAIASSSIFPTIWRSIFDLDFFSSTWALVSTVSFSSTVIFFSCFSGSTTGETCFSTVSSLSTASFSIFGFNVFSRSILPTSFTSGLLISVLISTDDFTPEESLTRTLSSLSDSSLSIFSEKSPIETDSFFLWRSLSMSFSDSFFTLISVLYSFTSKI